MNTLHDHYRLLLGLDANWTVGGVDLSLEARRVEIRLEFAGSEVRCPECGTTCARHDMAPERTWRHLDTMQFETILKARTPRANCAQCGVKTCQVPWADKSSRFTLWFEAFAVLLLQSASSVKAAALLLGLDWDSVNAIMRRAVERGLRQRSTEEVRHIGIDEKSFRSGQSYASLLFDLDGARVLEAVEDRTEEAAKTLLNTLPEPQKQAIQAVAVDMSLPFLKAIAENLPEAAIVHDKFHVSKHLNEAVDQVRRAENKVLKQDGDETLKGTRQLWLYSEPNLTEDAASRFASLKKLELKTARAWAIKEHFRWFWTYHHSGYARQFFDQWYAWASRCRLKPIFKVARMLKRHLDNLLTYTRHKITNSMAEGFNSKIQNIKANARGFRSFESYRTRILFFCGKLNLLPPQVSHYFS